MAGTEVRYFLRTTSSLGDEFWESPVFMKSRRSIALAAIVASLAIFAGACGGSDEGAKKSTSDKTESTTKDNPSGDKSGSNPGDSNGDASVSTESEKLTDADFTTKVDKIAASIKAAGTDACKVATAQNTEPPEPTNPTQVAAVVKVYSQLLRSMAGVLPDSAAAPAASLKKAADEVEKAAKDANYSTDFLNSNSLATVLTNADVTDGISAFAKATKGCPGSADMSGSEATPKG